MRTDWETVLSYWETSSESFVMQMLQNLADSGYFKKFLVTQGNKYPIIDGQSPLVFMLDRGWFEAFDEILKFNVSINLISTQDGGTIIYQLINKRDQWDDDERLRFTRYLMDRGADPRIAYGESFNALESAAYFGDYPVYSLMLQKFESAACDKLLETLHFNVDSQDRESAISRTELIILLEKSKQEDMPHQASGDIQTTLSPDATEGNEITPEEAIDTNTTEINSINPDNNDQLNNQGGFTLLRFKTDVEVDQEEDLNLFPELEENKDDFGEEEPDKEVDGNQQKENGKPIGEQTLPQRKVLSRRVLPRDDAPQED